jgi:hypothetical protein
MEIGSSSIRVGSRRCSCRNFQKQRIAVASEWPGPAIAEDGNRELIVKTLPIALTDSVDRGAPDLPNRRNNQQNCRSRPGRNTNRIVSDPTANYKNDLGRKSDSDRKNRTAEVDLLVSAS